MSDKDSNNTGAEQPRGNGTNDGLGTPAPDSGSLIFQRKGTTQLDTSLNGGDIKKGRE